MSQDASSTRTRRKPDVAYARLVEIAAERGLTLLTKEWVELKSYYEFRCASGHDVTRIGTVAMRGTITCLQCEHVRVQFLFQELLSERGIVCHEEPISVKRRANASAVRLDMNGLLRRAGFRRATAAHNVPKTNWLLGFSMPTAGTSS